MELKIFLLFNRMEWYDRLRGAMWLWNDRGYDVEKSEQYYNRCGIRGDNVDEKSERSI